MPKVSVVVPAYNSARFIEETIRSVLDQTYQDFEIIVVDDGSTDTTAALVKAYGDRVRYVWQENQGPSAARNTGKRSACGEFIALLDADDLWCADFLETLVPVLGSDPELGAAYCGWQHIDAAGNPLPQTARPRRMSPRCFREKLVWGNFLSVHAVLVRRTCYEQVGLFDESLSTHEDWDMWLRMSTHYRFGAVPHVLAKYRLHDRNMSSNAQQAADGAVHIVRKHFGTEEGDAIRWPEAKRRAYGGAHLRASTAYLEIGEEAKAHKHLLCAFQAYPELNNRLTVFYDLACAHQPRGFRGDFGTLELREAAHGILGSLDSVYTLWTGPHFRRHRSRSYGQAYLVLGLLAYGCGHMRQARQHVVRAISQHPRMVLHPQTGAILLKSYLPSRWLNKLRTVRRRWQPLPNVEPGI